MKERSSLNITGNPYQGIHRAEMLISRELFYSNSRKFVFWSFVFYGPFGLQLVKQSI